MGALQSVILRENIDKIAKQGSLRIFVSFGRRRSAKSVAFFGARLEPRVDGAKKLALRNGKRIKTSVDVVPYFERSF